MFRSEGFRLVGDKGKKVPKLGFENLKLSVSLTLQMTLSFDPNTKKWIMPSKGFNLKVLSFKGPYGINRRCVWLLLWVFIVLRNNCTLWTHVAAAWWARFCRS
jgi:hypothetical protein